MKCIIASEHKSSKYCMQWMETSHPQEKEIMYEKLKNCMIWFKNNYSSSFSAFVGKLPSEEDRRVCFKVLDGQGCTYEDYLHFIRILQGDKYKIKFTIHEVVTFEE